MGCSPNVSECDGNYNHDSRKNFLQWNLPIIDSSNKSGSMEFNAAASIPGDFFPIQVSFTSKTPYADLKANSVMLIDDEVPVKFSSDTIFYPEVYEIV